MTENLKSRVFFNASVILAGLHSRTGASGTLLTLVRQRKIIGIISEIVWNEVIRNTIKIGLSREKTIRWLHQYFLIISAPEKSKFPPYKKITVDEGDIHLFVSAEESKSCYLVSLDKKHVLTLQKHITSCHIVSPKELMEYLHNHTDVF